VGAAAVAKPKKPAKAKEPAKGKAMPICIAMLICENVIVGKDEVASAIRIFDTLTVPLPNKTEVGELCQFGHLQLMVILKNADAQGDFQLVIVCRGPDGQAVRIAAADVTLEGEPEAGKNMAGPLVIRWSGFGLYWIELMIGDTLIAKTPLKIKPDETKPAEGSAEAVSGETGVEVRPSQGVG
jgi:hypothetical protein